MLNRIVMAGIVTAIALTVGDASAFGRRHRCAPPPVRHYYLPSQPCIPCDPPGPNPQQSSGKVHALLIGLTGDEKIGKGIKTNLDRVKDLLEKGLPADRLGTVRVVQGAAVTADNIRSEADKLEVKESDTLFCYYSGHGAYDPTKAEDDPSNGHHFQIPTGDLMRKDLTDRLNKKRTKLTVLITDTCNVKSVASLKTFTTSPPKGAKVNPVLVALLLGPSGFVDVSGSAKDQYGWFTSPQPGGWFTFNFCTVCDTGAFPTPDKTTWKDFLAKVSDETNDYFQKQKKSAKPEAGWDLEVLAQIASQPEQRPQAFALDVK